MLPATPRDHEFCDACPGCQPVMLDAHTGIPLPDSDPKVVVLMRVWRNETSWSQRRACIRVWVHNSDAPADMFLHNEVVEKLHKAWKIAGLA